MTQPDSIPPPDPSAARRRRLEEKLSWNERNLASLQRSTKRIPWLALLAVLAVPAGFFYGFVGVGLTLAATVFTLGSSLYLAWGHRTEYQNKIAELKKELRRL